MSFKKKILKHKCRIWDKNKLNRSIHAEGVNVKIESNLSFAKFKSFRSQRTTIEGILMCFAMNIIGWATLSDANLVGKPFWYSLLDSEVS